jgi:phospholipid-binding lipoprotein MlaA
MSKMRNKKTTGRLSGARRSAWGARSLALIVLAVSSVSWAEADSDPDPWEGTNRKIYGFNDRADRAVLKPAAKAYEFIFPAFIRRGIHNIFRNVETPVVAVNQVLQGKGKPAASDTARFVVNSTLGIAGIFDVATRLGLAEHEEDFGQTLEVWGVGQGRFVMIPIRGPATITHAVGMLVESLVNPLQLISPARDRYIIKGLSFVETRAGLLSAEVLLSGDKYLFLRDAYMQRREYLINDGEILDDPFLDDFDDVDD